MAQTGDPLGTGAGRVRTARHRRRVRLPARPRCPVRAGRRRRPERSRSAWSAPCRSDPARRPDDGYGGLQRRRRRPVLHRRRRYGARRLAGQRQQPVLPDDGHERDPERPATPPSAASCRDWKSSARSRPVDAANDGAGHRNPDIMTHVRTAAAMPEGERPTVRVLDARSAAFRAHVDEVRATRGLGSRLRRAAGGRSHRGLGLPDRMAGTRSEMIDGWLNPPLCCASALVRLAAGALALAQAQDATPAPATATATSAASDWRTVPAENLLIIDTNKGRILVELAPEVAPLHVERMRLLARRGLLRRHRLPPRHRRLHGPDRRSAGHRRGPEPLSRPQGRVHLPPGPRNRRSRRSPNRQASMLGFLNALPVQTQPDDADGHDGGRQGARLGRLLPGRGRHGPRRGTGQRQQPVLPDAPALSGAGQALHRLGHGRVRAGRRARDQGRRRRQRRGRPPIRIV